MEVDDLLDDAYDPPRTLPRLGNAVIFDGDSDWVWLDTVPFDQPMTGGETMIVWNAGEVGLVLSRPKMGDGYLFVKILTVHGVGYYYADQLTVLF